MNTLVPAHITKKIECSKSATKLICSCEAHGIPTPRVFWTKDNSPTVLESGNHFNISINRGKDGRYHCNAVNKLATAVDTYNVFLFGNSLFYLYYIIVITCFRFTPKDFMSLYTFFYKNFSEPQYS